MSDGLDSEVKGIGALLEEGGLSVPLFQREFSWSDEQVLDLLLDIQSAINSEQYFLGPVVFGTSDPEDASARTVIDGQQRFITCTLLVASIISELKRDGGESAETGRRLENQFVRTEDTWSGETTLKVIPANEDRGFLEELLTTTLNNRDLGRVTPKRASHKKIKKALDIIEVWVNEQLRPKKASQCNVKGAKKIVEFIRVNLKVLTLDVGTDENAYLIFETLNDRGMRLAPNDLLKNLLFGKGGDRLDEVKSAWSRMEGNLESTKRPKLLPRYIRHFWISSKGFVREKELFGRIRGNVTTEAQAAKLAKDLVDSSVNYSALVSPADSQWSGHGSRTKEALRVISLFGMVTPRPLLLSCLECWGSKEFRQVAVAIMNCGVRWVVCGGLGSGTLEKEFGVWGKLVRDNRVSSPKGLSSKLRAKAPSDEKFRVAFSEYTISNAGRARYLLRGIEMQKRIADGADTSLVVAESEDSLNLEHVLPKSPDKGTWSHLTPEEQEQMLNMVGNLTLLGPDDNRELGNREFHEKEIVYQKSPLTITSEISTKGNWDRESIRDRQAAIAKIAVKSWPLP